ncbi:hypothetical protein KKB99_07845, partial [bacterium]|nr:hypothetical protein [bacterium]MBU1025904.1 hypothetical protein [bacterium]
SISEALSGNYFWIEENMIPPFVSADPETPYFAEWGTAYLDNEPVKFFETTEYLQGKRYKEFTLADLVYNKKIIDPLKSHDPLEIENWDRLTNKTYYYSTRLLLEGTLNLPEDVLISINDIVGNNQH